MCIKNRFRNIIETKRSIGWDSIITFFLSNSYLERSRYDTKYAFDDDDHVDGMGMVKKSVTW